MDLLICGASARAAAGSAIRAGLRPLAIDLFADRDISAMCPAQRVALERWPADLIPAVRGLAPSPWIYTGGLENHPEIVDSITAAHPLCGNAGAVLNAVRNPFRVAQVLRAAGLACPAIAASPEATARGGRWLVKPLASAGGAGIAFYDAARSRHGCDADSDVSAAPGSIGVVVSEHLSRTGRSETTVPTPRESQSPIVQQRNAVYYQQWIDGPSVSAVFVARPDGTECAGVTRQLTGRPGAEFGYCGSIGPCTLPPSVHEGVERLGAVLARAFGLVGLFGVDFIVKDGQPWAVEVNPRYTASVEVLELATARALLADHLRACGVPAGGGRPCGRVRWVVGKRVVFADRPTIIPAPGAATWSPLIADVPRDGARFETGEPVLTVFAAGRSIEQCAARLERRHNEWLARLRAI